jgi:hypothetical protein
MVLEPDIRNQNSGNPGQYAGFLWSPSAETQFWRGIPAQATVH